MHQDVVIRRAANKDMARVSRICADTFDNNQLADLAREVGSPSTSEEQAAPRVDRSKAFTLDRLQMLQSRKQQARVSFKRAVLRPCVAQPNGCNSARSMYMLVHDI